MLMQQLNECCCLCEAAVELCMVVTVVGRCCVSLGGFLKHDDSWTWLLFAALTVTNVTRSSTFVMAPRICMRLGMPVGMCRPMVAVILLIPSFAVVSGHVSIILSWRSEEYGLTAAETLVRLFLPVINVLSTSVWFVYVLTPPVKKGGSPPKPQVASFVLRDADSKYRGSTCAICLEELLPQCLAGKLMCGHVYHYHCLRNWLDKGHQGRCPMRCSSAARPDLGGRMLGSEQPVLGRGLGIEI
ncbi:unnamed protein product [Prorocentrum cordatum]|uniref:RING-type domain-containing protein n=1 Tax=Prorocentrum cordatum TaxID=2364126 RepID=A0ABN9WWA3_9DINO|nr:unnamed protein product [Polarella glacialis]